MSDVEADAERSFRNDDVYLPEDRMEFREGTSRFSGEYYDFRIRTINLEFGTLFLGQSIRYGLTPDDINMKLLPWALLFAYSMHTGNTPGVHITIPLLTISFSWLLQWCENHATCVMFYSVPFRYFCHRQPPIEWLPNILSLQQHTMTVYENVSDIFNPLAGEGDIVACHLPLTCWSDELCIFWFRECAGKSTKRSQLTLREAHLIFCFVSSFPILYKIPSFPRCQS